jgi:hypothetical protein
MKIIRASVLLIVAAYLSMPVAAAVGSSLDYKLVGSSGDTIIFRIPSASTFQSCLAHPPDCSAFSPVDVIFNGKTISGLEIEFFGSSEFGGLGIEMGNESPEYINTAGPLLFSGDTQNLILQTGTFNLRTDTCCGALFTDPTWVLTVTPGCQVQSCGPGITENCVKHFAGPPFSRDGRATSMNAFFASSSGLTVQDVAAACGFKGFNWQQELTNLPCPSPFSANSTVLGPLNFCMNSSLVPPRLTASASFPFSDPPSNGGYSYPTGQQDFSFPFYYTEAEVISEEQKPTPTGDCINAACIPLVTVDGKRLSFFDAPSDPCLPGADPTLNSIWCGGKTAPAGSFMGFTTRLVGITQDDLPSAPLYEWTWADTYNQTSGGTPSTSHPLPAPSVDPGGTGGITITSINGAPQRPPSITCSANPNVLWPPNGKQVSVIISGVVTPGTQALVLNTGTFAVMDSEGQIQQSGSVTVLSDGTYSFTIHLVASRDGSNRNGRQYTITVTAADEISNIGSCSTVVSVQHDQGH